MTRTRKPSLTREAPPLEIATSRDIARQGRELPACAICGHGVDHVIIANQPNGDVHLHVFCHGEVDVFEIERALRVALSGSWRSGGELAKAFTGGHGKPLAAIEDVR